MTFTANGNTEFATVPGKPYAFAASGTFDGGTVTLQYSLDNKVTWVAYNDGAANVALTAAGGRTFTAPSVVSRVLLAGAGSPSITVNVFPTV